MKGESSDFFVLSQGMNFWGGTVVSFLKGKIIKF